MATSDEQYWTPQEAEQVVMRRIRLNMAEHEETFNQAFERLQREKPELIEAMERVQAGAKVRKSK